MKLSHLCSVPSIQSEPCISCDTPDLAATLTHVHAVAIANRLKVLGDSTRLRILDLLVQHSDPLCVCDITAQFAQHQPTISHHLRLLREDGLVACEKRGIWAYYWATDAGRRTLISLLSLL